MSSRSSILSSLWDDDLLNLQEPLDGRGELFYLLVSFQSALLDGLPDAVLDVVLKQDGAHLLKGRDDAPDLGENVYAVAFLVHHALHTAHVAGDERQIAGLHGDVGAGAYGDAYVCLRQGWGIVDAVAYHADLFTLGL